jgi:hypothetical protein
MTFIGVTLSSESHVRHSLAVPLLPNQSCMTSVGAAFSSESHLQHSLAVPLLPNQSCNLQIEDTHLVGTWQEQLQRL